MYFFAKRVAIYVNIWYNRRGKTEGGKEMAVKKTTVDEKAIGLLKKKLNNLIKALGDDKKAELPLDEMMEKTEIKKQIEDLKATIQFEEDFRRELQENENEQTKYQSVYEAIQKQLEIINPEAGYSPELVDDAKKIVDQLIYKELGLDRLDTRDSKVSYVKEHIENLRIHKNTIYGNIDETVFKEDMKKMHDLDKVLADVGKEEKGKKAEDKKSEDAYGQLSYLIGDYQQKIQQKEAEIAEVKKEIEGFKNKLKGKKLSDEEKESIQANISFKKGHLEILIR